MNQLLLSDGWRCKQRSSVLSFEDDFVQDTDWIEAQIPGAVHLDLLAAGRIPDPFWGLNENQLQWIGECDWLYHCFFELPMDFEHARELALCFDGLDTFATVWLNGTAILSSDNMFMSYRVPVGELLRAGRNELRIVFESALLHGQQIEGQQGQHDLWNGDSSRLYVRKAQYHYGWDWGPTLLTAGVWRAIRLEAYSTRIADLHCPVEVAADLHSASLPVQITLESHEPLDEQVLHCLLYAPTGEVVAEQLLPVSSNQLAYTFEVINPDLWWPRGYGQPSLYRLVAILQRGTEELDRQERRLGLRRLRLVQQPLVDEAGTSFFFEVNNTPIFCGGANWIPADSFTPRITAERYRAWLQLAADGNMLMLRIWGGGIYEEDIFYDICDELGLLVWQDFMFGCGIYPASDEFQASVRGEAEDNVRRLRHHASLVLWCGNNEDYAIAESLKLPESAFAGEPSSLFPARVIYEQVLPGVCQKLDPTRPYRPGSPYGGKTSADPTIGDIHVWGVWHGAIPYQDYPSLAGRFISEFGMEAFPVMETIAEFAPAEAWYPQSRILDFHNKDAGGPRRLAPYLIDNIRYSTDLAGYSYGTQFIQSEALAAALRGWRRRWQGPGREYTAGALVWQLNDCWPVTSWAIVDYALRPKPAYYSYKRELAPFVVGLAHVSEEQAAVWVGNSLTNEVHASLELRTWTLAGELVAEERQSIILAPNQSSDLGLYSYHRADSVILAARLLIEDIVLARAALWPEPFKYLTLADPTVTIERLDERTVRVSSLRPTKGLWLAAGADVTWSDNMLDLFPDDSQTLMVGNLDVNKEITARWLSQES